MNTIKDLEQVKKYLLEIDNLLENNPKLNDIISELDIFQYSTDDCIADIVGTNPPPTSKP